MDALKAPRGTAIARVNGPSVARNRNDVIARGLTVGEWVCYIDDDQPVHEDFLLSLLSRDKDIIGALYSTKRPPFVPIVFKTETPDDEFTNCQWSDFRGKTGVYGPVVACGTGGMLIRRRVFDAIKPPWFNAMEFTDDLYFCRKARKHGFQIFVDLDAKIGHTSTHTVWPVTQNGEYGVNVAIDTLHVVILDDGAEEPAAADPPRIILPGA
jgi:GT2 family glycosyltransferase